MRRPGGAVCPAMNATIGFVTLSLANAGIHVVKSPADIGSAMKAALN